MTTFAVNASPLAKLEDKLYREIRDFIYEKSGMFFADHKKYLVENRLAKRIEDLSLKSYNEYFYLIKFGAGKDKELSRLFDAVTTNETYFFRNEPQLEAFRKVVIPELLKIKMKSVDKRIGIWSAGSSTGEEPYTLSIILHEELTSKGHRQAYEILATDISNAVIQKAKEGIYNSYATRNLKPDQLSRYFLPERNGHRIKDEVRRPVTYQLMNLNETHTYPVGKKFDLIFCRNVLIYFDLESKKKVIRKFYDVLNPNGYMFIGHSESLHGISDAFKLIHFEKTLGYLKEP